MIKKLSTLPSLSAVRNSLSAELPHLLQHCDLLELSVSGEPGAVFDPGGAEEGYFSATGWSSARASLIQFFAATSAEFFDSVSSAVFDSIRNKIFNVSGEGAFEGDGMYVKIMVNGEERWLPTYIQS